MEIPPVETLLVKSADGTRLACSHQRTLAHEPTPTLVWVHGGFEHRQRYHGIMAEFSARGYVSYALDLRGHGQSGGTPVYIRHFDEYLDDLAALLNYLTDRLMGPLYVVGHSMGGLVVIRYLQERAAERQFTGAALSAPLLGVASEVPAWKRLLSKTVVGVLPRLAIDNGLQATDLSHDPEVVAAHHADPLIRRKATPAWFEEVLRQQALALKKADKMRTPLLVMTAGEDRLADTGRTRQFLNKLDQRVNMQHAHFEGFFHELFNESGRAEVIETLAAWLKATR